MISFVPAAAIVVVLAALALMVSSALFRDLAATRRALWLALASTGVAAVVCLPWVVGVAWAGRGAVAVFGVPIPASSAASWSSLLRFAAGPIGGSPLAFGFAVAALAPLVLARGDRFRWAGRFWSVALVFWVVAWVIGRGWTGSLAVDPLILLAPAAVAIAAAIGLGVAAFEEDLRAAEFGWRQLVTVVATGAVVLGALPTAISALPGRWNLPSNDFSQSVAWMRAKAADGAFRVLWLGNTNAIYQGSWAAGDGLAYATSENGGPDARWLWNPAGPGPAAGLASAVDLARDGGTDRLGRLLAPSGVRYVALLTSLAPEINGEQNPTEYPVPADVAPALTRQLDLSPVLTGTGITVYLNSDWLPQRAEVRAGTTVPRLDPPRPPGREPGIGGGARCGGGTARSGGRRSFRGSADQGDGARRLGPGRPVEPDRSDRGPCPAGTLLRVGGPVPGGDGGVGRPAVRRGPGGPAVVRGLDRHVAGGRGPADRRRGGTAVAAGPASADPGRGRTGPGPVPRGRTPTRAPGPGAKTAGHPTPGSGCRPVDG